MELLTVSLLAGAIAASIATTITLFVKSQPSKSERLAKEHTERRNELRELANSLSKAAVANDAQAITLLCSQLGLNLNPADSEDAALIQAAEALGETEEKSARLQEFTERMALLLKFDQDVEHVGSQLWFNRGPLPHRTLYAEFNPGQSQSPRSNKKWGPKWLFTYHFGSLAFTTGILFFGAVEFAGSFGEMLKDLNNTGTNKPAFRLFSEGLALLIGGLVWSGVYVWFKYSEKRILEALFEK